MSFDRLSDLALGAAVFSLSAAYVYGRLSASKVDRVSDAKQVGPKTLLRLLEGERKGMIRAPSISAITFYHGKISKEVVSNKVGEIIAANPWLLSRLVNSRDFGDVCALFPTSFDPLKDKHDCFQYLQDTSIGISLPYDDLIRMASKALVPVGTACLDKDIPQFKVTLIETKPDAEYALVVSLSHTIGDGHTFYQLYSMLDTDRPARALVSARRHEFTDMIHQTCGKELHSWLTTPYLIMGIIRTLMMPAPTVTAFTISREEVAALKKDFASSAAAQSGDKAAVPFVSTNDLVTSWFCRLCRSPYAMMAFNYRNKFPHYSDDMAGNYEGVIAYTAEDVASPAGVRDSLRTFNRGHCLPSALETIDFDLAVVTNWSSFYCDVRPSQDAVQTLHMPLAKSSDCIFRDTCVVFNTSRDTLGVMLYSRNRRDVAALFEARDASVKLLGERIL